MNGLTKKVAALLPILEARGNVYLFALGERQGINRWEIILSSDWSDTNYTAAIHVVADALTPTLEKSDFTLLAGVTIMPSSGQDIQTIPKSLETATPGAAKTFDVAFGDEDVRRMLVFKARRPTVTEDREDEFASAASQTG